MSAITDLKPEMVWHYFDEICKIPHPSKKERKLIGYLVDFGHTHHLETIADATGNVLIRKKATPGMENKPSVVLQSHIDMVAEKNNDTVFDFDKDPIIPYVDGDWVKARGTTLGADNGIGVAAQLALLASEDIPHGNIECLFTVEEETGLTGAKNFQSGILQSGILINLDSEEDGFFCIGCAGGIDTVATFSYDEQQAPGNLFFFSVKVSGLQGGHSGIEINRERGNAIKILARYLWTMNRQFPVYLQRIDGGNLHNAIPREASAIVAVPYGKKEDARVLLNLFIHDIEDEIPSEKAFRIDLDSENTAEKVIDKMCSDRLLNALYACPHGVIKNSFDIKDLPEVSTNLASVKMKDVNTIVVGTSQRSSVESEKHDIKNQIEALFVLAGAEVTHGDGYPGWKPNIHSRITNIAVDSYFRLFHRQPVVEAVHAGLECGLFLEKYPDLDMISIGPTILGNHSPAEKVHIHSVEKFWEHLKNILLEL
ncbi:MAG: aminoacyl-histidine dipeptidase [Prevotellaceae bacterium]|jgi:dipeptidase D|nr:aminoacyl-histidine dipeptidase [Prevotellaceae bacterium]